MVREERRWAALVGGTQEGKQDALRAVIGQLERAGIRVGGALQVPLMRGTERLGYDVLRVPDGQRRPLARPSDQPVLCDLGFDQDTFDEVGVWCDQPDLELVVLEAGSLESGGRGHWPTIQRTLETSRALLLLAVRPRVLANVALRLPDPLADVDLREPEHDLSAFAAALIELLRPASGA